MDPFSLLRDLLIWKTFSKLSLVTVGLWIVVGIIFAAVIGGIRDESKSGFQCNTKPNAKNDKDFIRAKCFNEYETKYNKLPVFGFVIINLLVIVIIAIGYSHCVKSRVQRLETRNADAEAPGQYGFQTEKRLFNAYCLYLTIELALTISFIVLQTKVIYSENFPVNFHCNLTKGGTNSTALSSSDFQRTSSDVYECLSPPAHAKTFASYGLIAFNGIFALVAFIEIVLIFSRLRNGIHFMQDSHFYNDHLRSNREPMQEAHLLEISRAQNKLQADLRRLKHDIITSTNQLNDLKQLFRPNPGEGPSLRDLETDQIFVNLVIHEGRAKYEFPEDRCKQLKVFSKPKADQPHGEVCFDNIIDGCHENILLVGRPGIGKTILSIKLLRTAASDTFKDRNFEVAFLVKLKRLNSVSNLNLRRLLTYPETPQNLSDEVWDYIIKNPSKVLLIFDGVDEFSSKEDISKDDSEYEDTVEEEIPLQCLFNKIVSRKVLTGATIVTTIRPTAVPCVKHLNFDRIIEILGFTSKEISDYVEKFTEGSDPASRPIIWKHLNSNINLFTFCYVPLHCFIICSCLSRLHSNGCNLPSRLTEIYRQAIKIFSSRHNDECRQSNNFNPSPPQKDLNKLGEIALLGLQEGRLTFTPKEVQGVEYCGLLHRLPDLESTTPLDGGEAQFCFMHLTVQEFLAAKHVVDTVKNTEQLRKFVSDKINQSAWQVVLQFVAGLAESDTAGEMPKVKIFTELLPMATWKTNEKALTSVSWNYEVEEPTTLTCWPTYKDKNLALRIFNCLYDLRMEQQSAVTSKIEEIGFNAVDFSDCQLAPIDCAAIVHFLKNADKTFFLTLECNNISWLGCMEIEKWAVQSDGGKCSFKLVSLNLSQNEIGCKGAVQLGNALENQNCTLTKLKLSYNAIEDKGVKKICDALKENRCKLTTLDLDGNKIGEKGAECLSTALKSEQCKLVELHLYSNNIRDKGAVQLCDALRDKNCRLTLLDIGDCEIQNEGFSSLRDSLKDVNCKLTVLRLSFNRARITKEENFFDVLADANCKLTELQFAGNSLGDEGVKHLSRALKDANCKLTVLSLGFNRVGHKGAQYLCDALKVGNCKLTVLDLGRNNVGADGAAYLADALKNVSCKLIKVNLAFNTIREGGAEQLAKSLKSVECKLTELNLMANDIGDKGVKHLTDALKDQNCKLTVLILERNKVENEGAAHLSEALKNVNCKLTKLSLTANNIGDEGAKQLQDAFENENCKLAELDIDQNNIDDEQAASLCNALEKV